MLELLDKEKKMEDYNNDHDKEIIDVVFCSEDGVYIIIYIINIIINILL